MIDWRERISGEPGASVPTIKDSGIEVETVLRLLGEGWEIARIRERFPELSADDVHACLVYAVELLELERHRAELRRRAAEAKAHPDRGIPAEEVLGEDDDP